MSDVDLFGGADGWGVGARSLDLRLLGVELESIVCATREAAGAETIQGDVAELDPLGFAPCRILVGSPPCPPWSQAGKREGAEDWPIVRTVTEALAEGRDLRAEFKPKLRDARSLLVVEPLRWALALRPEVIALEQVPPVLPYWREVAAILGEFGYSTWCGILEAERYGVPQTRERAILMASSSRTVHPPAPTHQRYIPGEAARHELTLEGELLPWVSMAEALGWGDGRVGFARRADEGEATEDGYRARDFRGTDEPAHTLSEKSRSWTREDGDEVMVHEKGNTKGGTRDGLWRSADEPSRTIDTRADQMERVLVNGNQERATVRRADEPASTVAFGHAAKDVKWINGTHEHRAERRGDEPAPTVHFGERLNKVEWELNTGRDWTGDRDDAQSRPVDEPAPTLSGAGRMPWQWRRPATTVAGDPRVHPPGHKENADDPPDTYEQRRGANAIRVTVEEAALLQGFPPGYPWQGNRTQQFQQVGNAFPPPLARAVLEALTG